MQLAPTNPHEEHQSLNQDGHKSKHHRHSHGHGHSHGGNCHSDQEMKDAGIASIAWMVIMGEGMHNFSDGLAIGEKVCSLSAVCSLYGNQSGISSLCVLR